MSSIKKTKTLNCTYEEFDIKFDNLSETLKKSVERMARKIIKLRRQKQVLVTKARE